MGVKGIEEHGQLWQTHLHISSRTGTPDHKDVRPLEESDASLIHLQKNNYRHHDIFSAISPLLHDPCEYHPYCCHVNITLTP